MDGFLTPGRKPAKGNPLFPREKRPPLADLADLADSCATTPLGRVAAPKVGRTEVRGATRGCPNPGISQISQISQRRSILAAFTGVQVADSLSRRPETVQGNR